MYFERIPVDGLLQRSIECFWIAENDDPTPRHEKIVPDGFTEIILHTGDPYRICIDGTWKLQSRSLVGGQLTKHFYLENTGRSEMIGIKLKATALAHLFNLRMSELTDRVVDTQPMLGPGFADLEIRFRACRSRSERIEVLVDYFSSLPGHEAPVDRAVDLLMSRHGMISIAEVSEAAGVGERQLENLFRKFVGLTPKLFARILRFSYAFQLDEEKESWADLVYEAAFFDQAHFIRNFRDFTGESPGKYPFNESNMANFFLRKRPA